jgi:hypothetical protein
MRWQQMGSDVRDSETATEAESLLVPRKRGREQARDCVKRYLVENETFQ